MTVVLTKKEKTWMDMVIREEEITRYMGNGRDFINDYEIWEKLKRIQIQLQKE